MINPTNHPKWLTIHDNDWWSSLGPGRRTRCCSCGRKGRPFLVISRWKMIDIIYSICSLFIFILWQKMSTSSHACAVMCCPMHVYTKSFDHLCFLHFPTLVPTWTWPVSLKVCKQHARAIRAWNSKSPAIVPLKIELIHRRSSRPFLWSLSH